MLHAMPTPASHQSIRRAAADVLRTRSLTHTELIHELRAVGLDLGDDAVDTVMRAIDGDGRFAELADERWVSVPHLLEGTAWTTTVPDPPPADDCLPVEPDLSLLGWWALDTPLPLAGGRDGSLEFVELDDGSTAFLGPPGWLEGDDEGGRRTLVFTVVDGAVTLSRLERPPEPSAEQARAVRAAFDAGARHDELVNSLDEDTRVELVTIPLEDLLWEAVSAARERLRRARRAGRHPARRGRPRARRLDRRARGHRLERAPAHAPPPSHRFLPPSR